MKNKLFTRFMCLILAALCLPVFNAFALDGVDKGETANTVTTIIDILRVNVEVPAGGRVPSFEATALSSSMLEYQIANYNYEYDSEYYHNFYKNGIQWYDLDNDRALKEGEAFVTGTRYRVDIAVKLNYGTDIWGVPYYVFDENVAGYVNGIGCEVSRLGANDEDRYRKLSYTFSPCEEAPADISSVNLWIGEPMGGATADFEYTTNNVGFKPGEGGTFAVNGITWYDADTQLDMDITDTFKEGHRYTVIIELNAVSPYMFATNSDGTSKVYATINGYKAEVYCNYQTVSDMDSEIWLRYTFEECKKIINTVEIMDFSLPKEDAKGDIAMKSPNNSIYNVTGVTWKDNAGNSIAVWNGNTGYSSQSGVFEAGVTYTVEITLAAHTGYVFATDSKGNPTVTASASGFELQAKPHYAYASQSYIIVEGRFICKQTYVSYAQIFNLEEPVAGKRPDYTANSRGVGYHIEDRSAKESVWQNGQYVDAYYKYAGVAWYDLTDGRYIYDFDTFKGGHTYVVYIDVVADYANGYEFKRDKSDSYSLVEATINDKQAHAVSKTSNPFWFHYIEGTFYCEGVDVTKGDINGDGDVDNTDALMALKYDAGIIDLDDIALIAGDVNGDGYVDNTDALMILKYDAGIIDEL